MGWSHPDISLEDLLKLIKGFVDILILASGYQSSGLQAHWDVHNIRKAFQWGLFFENVFTRLSSSDGFQASVKELDMALSEMTSDPLFPQGLAHLSSVGLTTGRDFVLEHLIHNMPLRDAHLRAFLDAIIEMDLDELSETKYDCLDIYLDKLKLLNESLNLLPASRDSKTDPMTMSPKVFTNMKIERCTGDAFTKLTVQELLKRQFKVSCILSAETGLDIVSKIITQCKWTKFDISLVGDKLKNATDPLSEEQSIAFVSWNNWTSKNLSYLLERKTIRLVSGASMIFSAPKTQWVQVFKRMNISSESCFDDLCEATELMLLGCMASIWNCVIEHLMFHPFDSCTVSKQYHELCNLHLVGSQNLHCRKETRHLKESGILEYLAVLLGSQLHLLWKLSPILVAVSIPSWSPLFRLYLSEIDTQFKGEYSKLRCCSCTQEGKEHQECELAERIWCLYVSHVCGSHLILGARTRTIVEHCRANLC